MPEPDLNPPPVLEPAPAPAPPPAPSPLLARLLNVFAMPGRVFEEVRQCRAAAGNWLVPALLCGVALALVGYVLVSTPAATKQLGERQAKAQEAQATSLAESVKAGKITQADADAALNLFDRVARPEVLKTAVAALGFVLGILRVFWWGLVLWVLARVAVRRPVRYGKALEVAGLASMLAWLSMVVMLALSVNIGQSFGASGYSLALTDLATPGDQNLTAIVWIVMNFWIIAVLGLGLARLTMVPSIRGVFLVFAYWVFSDLLGMLAGFVAMGA
jgi:hypothetical protein